jgi:hypothetical protein
VLVPLIESPWEQLRLRPALCRSHRSASVLRRGVVHRATPWAACATENQYACASDFKRTLRCTSGKWQQDQVCRGPDGCKEAGDRVHCDDTLAAVGDVCAQDGDQACSVDHDARLVCKTGKMVIDRKCAAGCLVVAGKVRAGREGPSFECK